MSLSLSLQSGWHYKQQAAGEMSSLLLIVPHSKLSQAQVYQPPSSVGSLSLLGSFIFRFLNFTLLCWFLKPTTDRQVNSWLSVVLFTTWISTVRATRTRLFPKSKATFMIPPARLIKPSNKHLQVG